MKLTKQIFRMEQDEIELFPFIKDGEPAFYKYLSTLFTSDWDNVASIDCTKIEVAPNIFNYWLDHPTVSTEQLAMELVLRGPKSNESLKDNEVLIEIGAFILKNENNEQPPLEKEPDPDDFIANLNDREPTPPYYTYDEPTYDGRSIPVDLGDEEEEPNEGDDLTFGKF